MSLNWRLKRRSLRREFRPLRLNSSESIQAHLRETVKEGIHARERVELEEEVERLNELGYQMQGALEVADRRDKPHHGEVVQLRGTISALERELEKSRSPSRAAEPSMIPSADIDALENELDEAMKPGTSSNKIFYMP